MCNLCETKPVYEFTNQRKLCKNCFIRYFQKKALYTNRKFSLIKKGDVIGYKKSQGFRDVVLQDVLKLFEEKILIKLVRVPNKKITKIAVSSTIDTESNKLIQDLIKGRVKLKDLMPKQKNTIAPLYLFLDKEVKLYAELKNLKFKETTLKRDNITDFVEDLEEKHPEIKRAIINSCLELYN